MQSCGMATRKCTFRLTPDVDERLTATAIALSKTDGWRRWNGNRPATRTDILVMSLNTLLGSDEMRETSYEVDKILRGKSKPAIASGRKRVRKSR